MTEQSVERILIYNAHVYTPTQEWMPGWVLTEGRAIRWMGPGPAPEFAPDWVTRKIDAGGMNLLPGFIDLHVHGGMGYEVMDASLEGLQCMAQFYARHGVTGFLATTWAAMPEALRKVLDTLDGQVGRIPGGASLLGVHLEGPFLNPVRSGAQAPQLIRRASPEEALDYLETGLVRLVALAPEFPENLWLADECVRRGITVSAAHTTATFDQMAEAIRHGVRQVTHCFNAMTALGHREPGTVGAALHFPEIRCELIADNIHVHPAAQRIVYRCKGAEGIVLVTDAIRGAGLPDGEYPIDDRTVVLRDGAVRLPDGTLAGSALTMDRALGNFTRASGQSLGAVWRASSLNAAQAIGVSHRKGSLEAGKDADLVLLDDQFNVLLTVAEGEIIPLG